MTMKKTFLFLIGILFFCIASASVSAQSSSSEAYLMIEAATHHTGDSPEAEGPSYTTTFELLFVPSSDVKLRLDLKDVGSNNVPVKINGRFVGNLPMKTAPMIWEHAKINIANPDEVLQVGTNTFTVTSGHDDMWFRNVHLSYFPLFSDVDKDPNGKTPAK